MDWKNARTALAAACRSDPRLKARLVELTGVSRTAVWRWLNGTARPAPDLRLLIEAETKGQVRAIWWLSADERAALQHDVDSVRRAR